MGGPHREKVSTLWLLFVKGHGNEADFLGFLQKLVPHESLTLPYGSFRFWLRIRGDIRIRCGELTTLRIIDTESFLYKKFNSRLSVSVIRGVTKSPYL